MKRCSRCGEDKPLDQFNRDGSRSDGRQSQCRRCSNAAGREWNQADSQRPAASNRARRARYAKRHPEKVRAHRAVRHALERGKLVKPDRCQDCGKATARDDLHAHHHDYSKPLDVTWLCGRGCHRDRHAKT